MDERVERRCLRHTPGDLTVLLLIILLLLPCSCATNRRVIENPGVDDWYTSDTIGDLTITFLPANHRSGRSMYESNQTLWGGWLFEWNGRRVYFAGDTGYSAVFRDIRSRTGDMDVCLMPITAWFQRPRHTRGGVAVPECARNS